MADAGGNAVDAALAAVMAGMISDPGIIGPGAGCFLTIWDPAGAPIVIDAYAAMPGLGVGMPRDFGDRVAMEYGGGMETLVGARSVAVPGAWRGLGAASERFGALAWSQLLGPAIDLAASGFPLSGSSEAYLAHAHEPIYDRRPDSFAALHHADGSRVADGDMIRIAGLADSLRIIADEGPDSFYTGTIGQRLVAAMGEWGGSITATDLADYEAVVREPIRLDLDGWQVATNPPPALGGAVLGALLLFVGSQGFSRWDRAGARLMAEIQRAVLRYRGVALEGPVAMDAAVATLLDAARLGDYASLASSPSTIHVSAVDTAGLACAVTTSAGYGSGMMIPGTGLWLNNCLGELELFPHGVGDLAPGDRLPSNMAPTVVRSPSGGMMAIGSPGASRITTAMAQVIANIVTLDMSVSDAVEHPRLHVEVYDGVPTIAHEPGIPVEPFDDLVTRRFPDRSMYFGGVGLALHEPGAGLFQVADSRRTGAVAVGGL